MNRSADIYMHFRTLIKALHTCGVLGFELAQIVYVRSEGGLSQEASRVKFGFALDRSIQSIDPVHIRYVIKIDRAVTVAACRLQWARGYAFPFVAGVAGEHRGQVAQRLAV